MSSNRTGRTFPGFDYSLLSSFASAFAAIGNTFGPIAGAVQSLIPVFQAIGGGG